MITTAVDVATVASGDSASAIAVVVIRATSGGSTGATGLGVVGSPLEGRGHGDGRSGGSAGVRGAARGVMAIGGRGGGARW